jgi:succinate-semialdehyde dehydrogenase/glutarate-semialdehyde dehydrogenase
MSDKGWFRSVNPATEETLATLPESPEHEVAAALERGARAFRKWSAMGFDARAERLRAVAATLRSQRTRLGGLATAEMGKPISEAEAEIDKCAWAFDYFAEHAASLLAGQLRASSASRSTVEFVPLGTVLAIMPWNFPFWQVMRFAAPTLAAGNTAVLKHASNVPQCADACERVFIDSGFPPGVFSSLRLSAEAAERLVEHPAIAAATLTGSERAGAAIAAAAGRAQEDRARARRLRSVHRAR